MYTDNCDYVFVNKFLKAIGHQMRIAAVCGSFLLGCGVSPTVVEKTSSEPLKHQGKQPSAPKVSDAGIRDAHNDAQRQQLQTSATTNTPSQSNIEGEIHTGVNGWVLIEGGTFKRGEKAWNTTTFKRQVTVPTFKLLRHEVTVAEFTNCVDLGHCDKSEGLTAHSSCNYAHSDGDRETHPMNCVTRDDADAYCRAVGGRLPTASEWEYAARGRGKEIQYPWGNDGKPSCTFAIVGASYGSGCSEERTWPVCSKPRGNTAQGLCDMYGSVLEFVADGYSPEIGDVPQDGSAKPYDPNGAAVLRGGASWMDFEGDNRHIYTVTPFEQELIGENTITTGIRCARNNNSSAPTPFKDLQVVKKVQKPVAAIQIRPLEWIPIKGGTFHIGEVDDNPPGKKIKLADFKILKTEVTVAQYKQCKACAPAAGEQNPSGPEGCNWSKERRENHPVNCITWNMAAAYCKSIGARLPSETQWEYVARNRGEKIKYPWGNKPYPTCDYAVVGLGETRISGCGEEHTFPVCSKPKGNTKQGVCDILGNVTEWTADRWVVKTDKIPNDGQPATQSKVDAYTFRGGSFISELGFGIDFADNTSRKAYPPTVGMEIFGFRCVR